MFGEVGRHGLRGGGGGDCGGGLGERLLGCIGINDDDMALLEVVDECVEVGQVQPATCVVAALRGRSELTKHWGEEPGGTHKLVLPLEHGEGVDY